MPLACWFRRRAETNFFWAFVAPPELRICKRESANARGFRPGARRALPNQPAFAEIAEITAGRALDHVDGELEQANFPGVVHTLNHCAERFAGSLHAAFCAIDHCVDRIAKCLLAQIGFAKLKTIPKHCDVPCMFP